MPEELTPELKAAIIQFLKENLRIETDVDYEFGGESRFLHVRFWSSLPF